MTNGTGETEFTPAEEAAILAQAKVMGYKEDYSGNSKLGPREFVQRANERLDIARGTIKTMERTNLELVEANKGLGLKLDSLTGQFKSFVEMSRGADERAYKRAKAELESKMDTAAAEGDTDRYKAAKTELKDLEASVAAHPALTGVEQPAATTQSNIPGVLPGWSVEAQEAWEDKNPWYTAEPDMMIFAEAVDRGLSRSKTAKGQTFQQRLDAIEVAVKKKFPEYFGQVSDDNKGQTTQRIGAVDSSTGEAPASKSSKRTYSNLLPEAKRMCDDLVKDGILKQEDYVNNADDTLFR